MGRSSSISRVGRARPGIAALTLVLFALAATAVPAEARAEAVRSEITASITGIIDSRATVVYFYSGQVSAEHFIFGCMERRRVVLFRIGPKGGHHPVTHTETKFFGKFIGTIDKRLAAIPGYYFARVEPQVRHTRKGRLRCLGDRSPAFFVDVPGGLLTPPPLAGPS
jgi:hypothetical protein